ncbi:transcription mediator complex subunit Med12-domain-containing protein [Chiua virens]|nr:transcription mediator complex subunit Med12-domain-containing protein [Chiua virens]
MHPERHSTQVTPSPWTFKMPSHVTLNDAKRQAWFADLANGNVPLHKLGKSVPRGARGHNLLDLLQSNNVAIPRAIWFLRVLGANETVRPSFPQTIHHTLNCYFHFLSPLELQRYPEKAQ